MQRATITAECQSSYNYLWFRYVDPTRPHTTQTHMCGKCLCIEHICILSPQYVWHRISFSSSGHWLLRAQTWPTPSIWINNRTYHCKWLAFFLWKSQTFDSVKYSDCKYGRAISSSQAADTAYFQPKWQNPLQIISRYRSQKTKKKKRNKQRKNETRQSTSNNKMWAKQMPYKIE